MKGEELHQQLAYLSKHFSGQALPKHGRYVNQSAQTNTAGVVEVPPAPPLATELSVAELAALAALGLTAWGMRAFRSH